MLSSKTGKPANPNGPMQHVDGHPPLAHLSQVSRLGALEFEFKRACVRNKVGAHRTCHVLTSRAAKLPRRPVG
jgi:hypothetical protein